MERSKLIQELFKTTTDTEIISAVETIRKRSLGSNDDPIVVIVGFDGGWSNLETVVVNGRHEAIISPQTDLPFSDE